MKLTKEHIDKMLCFTHHYSSVIGDADEVRAFDFLNEIGFFEIGFLEGADEGKIEVDVSTFDNGEA